MSKTDYEEYIDVQVDELIKKLEMYGIYKRKFNTLDEILKDLEERKKDFSDPKSPQFERKYESNKHKDATNDFLVKFISKEKVLENDKNMVYGKMKEVETIINLVRNEDVRIYMERHYVDGESFEKLSGEKFCSRMKMYYAMKKELKKLIMGDLNKQ